jgi:hypothetical protein
MPVGGLETGLGPRGLDEIVAGAVDGALAADTKVGTGRAMSASACGRISPSETGVGAITPFPLGGGPPGGGCAHSPPMTVARTVLPMLPRAQVVS